MAEHIWTCEGEAQDAAQDHQASRFAEAEEAGIVEAKTFTEQELTSEG